VCRISCTKACGCEECRRITNTGNLIKCRSLKGEKIPTPTLDVGDFDGEP
jgi:hypothetical protein